MQSNHTGPELSGPDEDICRYGKPLGVSDEQYMIRAIDQEWNSGRNLHDGESPDLEGSYNNDSGENMASA